MTTRALHIVINRHHPDHRQHSLFRLCRAAGTHRSQRPYERRLLLRALRPGARSPLGQARCGSASTEATGCSTFMLESDVTYQREVHEGDPLDFTFQLIDFDAKRIHFFMTMLHARERWLAATSESISICIDMTTRRSTSWPADRMARLQALHETHSRRPRPAEVGRIIGIRRK